MKSKLSSFTAILLAVLLCLSQATVAATALSGSGTQENPYLIASVADLRELANKVNSGDSMKDKTVLLTANIVLSGDWTPIGTKDNPFNGSFDGNGFKISGLSVKGNDVVCLFGCSKGVIKNVKVEGSVSGGSSVGGIAGYSEGKISGCIFNGTVEGSSGVAGITGESRADIQNCVNRAGIKGKENVGGIVGQLKKAHSITDCVNYGTVTASEKQRHYGGIVGLFGDELNWSAENSIIKDCTNNGSISGGGYLTAGIAGYVCFKGLVTNCVNTGEVSAPEGTLVAGITGALYMQAELRDCTNTGKITGGDGSGFIDDLKFIDAKYLTGVAGIVGLSYCSEDLYNCVNKGEINGSRTAAGIVAISHYGGSCYSCSNFGNISVSFDGGDDYKYGAAGGIEGWSNVNAGKCFNSGSIYNPGETPTGGILGFCWGGADAVSNNLNTGKVTGKNNVGGIVEKSYLNIIDHCQNKGNLEAIGQEVSMFGGIVGQGQACTVKQCKNSGKIVTESTAFIYVGGISGKVTNSQIEWCINEANVGKSIDYAQFHGGIVGYAHSSAISNCKNTGLIMCSFFLQAFAVF